MPNIVEPDPDRLVSAALDLAARGIPVFPCEVGGKLPLPGIGLPDATTDPDQILRWWSRHPTANLAVPTGPATFDVLNIDVRTAPDGQVPDGWEAFDRARQEPAVLRMGGHVVHTPSGGAHIYYAGTHQLGTQLNDQPLGFHAASAYVLVPPSVVGGREYKQPSDLPTLRDPLYWNPVRDYFQPPLTPERPAAAQGVGPLADWVAGLREPERVAGTYWAASRAIAAGHEDLRQIVDAATNAGLLPHEAARVVVSAIKATPTADRPTRSPAPRPPTRHLPRGR